MVALLHVICFSFSTSGQQGLQEQGLEVIFLKAGVEEGLSGWPRQEHSGHFLPCGRRMHMGREMGFEGEPGI